MEANQPDFSGWATKANLKCSDGRTIMPDAFKHQDKLRVPLVWQHAQNEPKNVLGHAVLEAHPEGIYCHGFFNDTETGQGAKQLVIHEDITSLSIFANRLVEKSKMVLHGMIREVSLVLAGANEGAKIDFVRLAHGDGDFEDLEDEAVIYTGLTLQHSQPVLEEDLVEVEEVIEHADDKTVQDVFDTLSEDQKNVVYYLLGQAIKGGSAEHSDSEAPSDIQHTFESLSEEQAMVVHFMIGEALENAENSAAHADAEGENSAAHADMEDNSAAIADNQEGTSMTHNAFESHGAKDNSKALSHAETKTFFENAKRLGSLKEAFADYELKHGIEDIEILFPDAKNVTATPEWLKRRTEWVSRVMSGTRHTPFSRIKSLTANLTLPEARAKGYVKGNLKQEEFFKVSKRVTGPQTIYKKQKLDRDDILDITDFDVVSWLKGEMRLMLEEEIARAVLLGDGRSAGDDDKIVETNVRPIATDADLYVTYLNVNLGDASSSADEIIDALVLQRRHYRGSGSPTFFTSETVLAQLLLIKDTLGRRIYPSVADVAVAIRAESIVTVEVMDEPDVDVVGILVNLADYTIGSDKGGDVALFDDFDIDYNQYKYLIETRISGALVKPKSALVVKKTASNAVLVVPVAPTFDDEAHTVTVATTTGITYKNELTNATLVTGSPITLDEGDELTVIALPSTTAYYIASSTADQFTFNYDGAVGSAF